MSQLSTLWSVDSIGEIGDHLAAAEARSRTDALRGMQNPMLINSLTPPTGFVHDAITQLDRPKSLQPGFVSVIYLSFDLDGLQQRTRRDDQVVETYLSSFPLVETTEHRNAATLVQPLIQACRDIVPGVVDVDTSFTHDPEEGSSILRLTVSTTATVDDVFAAERELNARISDIAAGVESPEVVVRYSFLE